MKWLFLIPITLVIVILGLTIYLQPNDFLGCAQQPVEQTNCHQADAIIVVSGGDTKARTDEGIALYQHGWAEYLILSGAALDESGPSNALAMKRQAIAAGVPASSIFVDEVSVNTQQNAKNTQTISKANHFDDVILVTSGYHQRRSSLEFNKHADGITIRNYPVVADKDWNWYWWVTPRGWWLAGGEVVKIIGFYIGVTS